MIADVFWFTMEFGVIHDGAELKAYGAGICSSYGEIDELRRWKIRPLELTAMATQNYDITTYQPVLFAARVGEPPRGRGRRLLRPCDDDAPERIGAAWAGVTESTSGWRPRLGGPCRTLPPCRDARTPRSSPP